MPRCPGAPGDPFPSASGVPGAQGGHPGEPLGLANGEGLRRLAPQRSTAFRARHGAGARGQSLLHPQLRLGKELGTVALLRGHLPVAFRSLFSSTWKRANSPRTELCHAMSLRKASKSIENPRFQGLHLASKAPFQAFQA